MYVQTVNTVDVRGLTSMKDVMPLLKQNPTVVLEVVDTSGSSTSQPTGPVTVISIDKRMGQKPGRLGIKFKPTPGVGLMVSSIKPGLSAAVAVSVRGVRGLDDS